MRQERTDIHMALSPYFFVRLCIVDDCDEPVPVLPDVEDDITIYGIGIFEQRADFSEIVPPDGLDDRSP